MLTDSKIEQLVEQFTNKYDRQFTNGQISTDDYTLHLRRLDAWAMAQYDKKVSLRTEFVHREIGES